MEWCTNFFCKRVFRRAPDASAGDSAGGFRGEIKVDKHVLDVTGASDGNVDVCRERLSVVQPTELTSFARFETIKDAFVRRERRDVVKKEIENHLSGKVNLLSGRLERGVDVKRRSGKFGFRLLLPVYYQGKYQIFSVLGC